MEDEIKYTVVLGFRLRDTIESFDFKAIGENGLVVEVYAILENGYLTPLYYNINLKKFYYIGNETWKEYMNPVLMWCTKSDYKIELPKLK